MFKLSPWKRRHHAGTKASNRRTYRAIRDLSDHTLRDIGLSRPDVDSYRSGYDPRRGPDFL